MKFVIELSEKEVKEAATSNILNALASLNTRDLELPNPESAPSAPPIIHAAPAPQLTRQPEAPVQAVPTQAPIDPAAQQAMAHPAPQQQAAPAQAAVPTQAATYSQEQLALAATQLMDANKKQALLNLLAKFGVQTLTMLPTEQYGAFATELRALGAKI